MFNVALFEPEIPPNTGNIMRLCVNSGARLHLIEPLGFSLDDKQLRRAGLDYRDYAEVRSHHCLDDLLSTLSPARVLAVTTKGGANYDEIKYQSDDLILFGPETRGLPSELLDSLPPAQRIRIPMQPNSRSLNLSNAVAVVVYEAWRQFGFSGAS
ncbi:MAG: tRNA (uridine(34)/cytosine(34)/5-carboxymethylaminomethyluridine(34)-2'-O)-methyltransferase TrmL [Pseudomonadales bacterium]|jgi:tRNA (cytidine/uridine-2'-O-)-methyltransferase